MGMGLLNQKCFWVTGFKVVVGGAIQAAPNFDELLFDGNERVNNVGVEMRATPFEDRRLRHIVTVGELIDALCSQRIIHIG